jgi:hypothetical protein
VPTPDTPTVRSAWRMLPLALVGVPIAVALAFGVYALFGLCMEGDKAACTDPGSPYPSWWHLALVFALGWIAIAGPVLVALRRALKARRAGATSAIPVLVIGGVLLVAVTVVLAAAL